MMTPKENVMVATAKAEGVLCALYAIVRDMNIGQLVDENKNGKLGDVIGDTLAGLEYVREVWSAGGEDDEAGEA